MVRTRGRRRGQRLVAWLWVAAYGEEKLRRTPQGRGRQQRARGIRQGLNRKPEVALNQKVKNLIQKLGEAIHESVAESEHIAGVVKNIREQGFDVMLMLEATIGLNEVEDETEGAQLRLTAGEETEGPFTQHDVSFLKSLRISLPGDVTQDVEGTEEQE